MKKNIVKFFFFSVFLALGATSCTVVDVSVLSATNAPEESGIVFTRVTPESTVVLADNTSYINYLSINNKGTTLAYLSRVDGNDNIYTIDLNNRNISQQRTYRNNVVGGFNFSRDDEEIIFNSSDVILSSKASAGAICRQVATGLYPTYSFDGEYIFFTKSDGKQDFLWRCAVKNNELATLCPGVGVSPSQTNNTIYFLRSTTRNQRTFFEIRKYNYETGNEEVILSNDGISPLVVKESPDGKWLLFAGRKFLTKNNKWDVSQLFVVRTDGNELTQLTYHIGESHSPVWSSDGKTIYFISGRGNAQRKNAIWSMPFKL